MAEKKSNTRPQSDISRLMRSVNVQSWRYQNPKQVVASDNPQDVIDLEAYGRRGVHVVRNRTQYASSEEKEIISLSNFVIQRIAYRNWNLFASAATFFENLTDPSRRASLSDGDLFVVNDALVRQLEQTNDELAKMEEELVARYGDAPLPKSSRVERIAVPIASSLTRALAEMLVKADRLVSIVDGLYLSGDFGLLRVGQAKRKEHTDKIVGTVMRFIVYTVSARDRLRAFFDRKRAEEEAEAARLKAEREKQAEEERRRRELAKERREYARQQAELRAKEILDARENAQEGQPQTPVSDSDNVAVIDDNRSADRVPTHEAATSAMSSIDAESNAQSEGNKTASTVLQVAEEHSSSPDEPEERASVEPLPGSAEDGEGDELRESDVQEEPLKASKNVEEDVPGENETESTHSPAGHEK